MRTAPRRLISLNTWSQDGGIIWEGLGCWIGWLWCFKKPCNLPYNLPVSQHFLPPGCISRHELSVTIPGPHPPTRCHVSLHDGRRFQPSETVSAKWTLSSLSSSSRDIWSQQRKRQLGCITWWLMTDERHPYGYYFFFLKISMRGVWHNKQVMVVLHSHNTCLQALWICYYLIMLCFSDFQTCSLTSSSTSYISVFFFQCEG